MDDEPPNLREKQTICMVSDFFHPNNGGVEFHIFQLSQCLLERGHRVIVVTHFYDNRVGVRYLTNLLKVYYLPVVPFYNKSILPTIVGSIPRLRTIFLEEKVSIVHGHSAFSSLANEAMFIASILNIPTVFTDHSLFGFSDASAVVTNTFLKYSLANANHIICVSHTGKENTVLRSDVAAEKVSVIPNAVDWATFTPTDRPTTMLKKNIVTVVLGCRLVYRKGVDLVSKVIPVLCKSKFTNAKGETFKLHFIIAGDGPKRIVLEEMIEQHKLQTRVEMLGTLRYEQIRDHLLAKGDIYLNTSLTEAFCMAIVEAVSCGLTVVSTEVGGIPEVLPTDFIYFVEPNVSSIIEGTKKAVQDLLAGKRPSGKACNKFVQGAYDWREVATRTEIVYSTITRQTLPTLARRVRNLWERGPMAGPLMAMLFLASHYIILALNYLNPL